MESQMLDIRGMTCAACAQRIEKVVRKLPGIEQANVNLASEKLFVEYDSSVLKLDQIKEKVEKIGYQVVERSENTTVTIPIGGMTCAACAQRISKVLGKLEGVEDATVNFATEKATVIYDPQKVRLSVIKGAIEKAGYQALEINKADAADEDRERKQREIKTLWTKFSPASPLHCHGANDSVCHPALPGGVGPYAVSPGSCRSPASFGGSDCGGGIPVLYRGL